MKQRLAIMLLNVGIDPRYPRWLSRAAWAVRNRIFPMRPAQPDDDFDFVF